MDGYDVVVEGDSYGSFGSVRPPISAWDAGPPGGSSRGGTCRTARRARSHTLAETPRRLGQARRDDLTMFHLVNLVDESTVHRRGQVINGLTTEELRCRSCPPPPPDPRSRWHAIHVPGDPGSRGSVETSVLACSSDAGQPAVPHQLTREGPLSCSRARASVETARATAAHPGDAIVVPLVDLYIGCAIGTPELLCCMPVWVARP